MQASRTIGHQPDTPAPVVPRWRRTGPVAVAIAANIGIFMVLFQLYKMVRKTFIVRGETIGYDNAEQIIALERRLHLFFEPDLQRWLIDNHLWVIRGLNWYYASFMWLFYACCVTAIVLAPVRFRQLRRVFLCSMLLALPWYALYPLAPPRFMPQYGLFDTLAMFGPNYFSEGGMVSANRYAAMPSMHIGWTTIGAFMLAAAIPYRRIGTLLGATHVSLMTLTVMATGNHYVADVVGGWLIVIAAFALANLLPDPLPLPWRQRTPKPEPARLRTQPAGAIPRR